jgi:hypothetical protein
MSSIPHMGEVGSVPLHLHYKEEELSQSSRQPSCASTSTTLSPIRSQASRDKEVVEQPRKSVGQKLAHAILNLAPAFFSLNMVSM